MEASQSYSAATSGASSLAWPTFTVERTMPSLPHLIEQLQNIHLLAQDVADYTLLRSVEQLALEVQTAIGRTDSRILDAIAPADSCR